MPPDAGPAAQQERRPHFWAGWPAYLACWFALQLVVQGGLQVMMVMVLISNGATLESVLEAPPDSLQVLPWTMAIEWAALFTTLLVTHYFLTRGRAENLAFIGLVLPRKALLQSIAGILIEGGHFLLIFGIGLALGIYHVVSVSGPGPSALILLLASLVLLPAALVEEATMRGYLFRDIEQRHGLAAAVLISSVVFALIHSMNPSVWETPWPMLGLFAAGLLLAAAFVATRNLLYPTMVHMIWNLMEGPVLGLPISGISPTYAIFETRVQGSPLLTGGGFGPEAGLPAILTTFLWIPVIWWGGRLVSDPPGARIFSPRRDAETGGVSL